ncbi:MAG TPA: NAD(P)-binding protein, partial [Rubrivivax sp.]|nr:NAD(P)-binding protein [Rubrivivax sp.]
MPVRDVVVVGGGLAGLACAAACAQAGARIELLESAASPLSRAAHLEIVPNLLRDLDTLGVAQACVRQGFAFSGSSVVDEDGTLRAELPSRRLAGPLLPPSVGIVYEDLLAILAQRARALG